MGNLSEQQEMMGKKIVEDEKPKRSLVGDRRNRRNNRIILFMLMIYDIIAVNLSYFLALLLRFDLKYTKIDQTYLDAFKQSAPIYTVFCIIVFMLLKLYRSIWRFASYIELMRIMAACFITTAFNCIFVTVAFVRMPLVYYVFGAILQCFFLLVARFSYRLFLVIYEAKLKSKAKDVPKIMIIGAGSAGQMILRDINRSDYTDERVACVIDDDESKWGRYIEEVPVVGGRDEIMAAAKKYGISKIYIALPSASAADKRDIINICQETGCVLKNLPGMYQLVLGQVTASQMRNVAIEDLLGREPIKADMTDVFNIIAGKTVLVTGGGGSIGSELCRQIAKHNPKRLIIFDIYENNAYAIQLELREKYPNLKLETLIGSVRDSRKIFQVFQKYRPEIVYHAAAHKHVPLMEDSPCEAIKNNAIGTYKTAYAAMTNGCERFVLISTDKAVNPTNIMGASKRLCEMVIQSFDAKIKAGKANEIPQLFTHEGVENADKDGTGNVYKNIKTQFVAVRFGNVLGSNGSVIPIFKSQIEKGGPVTVTHPDIIRYFMTIPEAVSLVLLAGTYANGGEIFVLDMGSPVKIADLARNLIRLSGYKPDVDIKIEYTGLRPGEKLFEEKLMAEEGLKKTDNDLIHIGQPIPFETDEFLGGLGKLMELAYENKDGIKEQVQKMVSTYHPAENK